MAILGYDQVGGDSHNIALSSGNIGGGKFSCPASGPITQIVARLIVTVPGNVRCAIYSDNAGSPDALLAESSETAVAVNGWFAFPTTAFIDADVVYWLAIRSDRTDGSIFISRTNTGVVNPTFTDDTSSAYPVWDDPIGTVSFNANIKYSIYAIVNDTPNKTLYFSG